MSLPEPQPALGKIFVALDSTASSADILAAAVEWAARLQAELHGLFVEDINLLHAAALPFAQEIAFTSPFLRPLKLEAVERTLGRLAEQVRQALAEHAERLRVPWTFAVTRGRLARLPLDIVEAADLLILCNQPRLLRRGRTTPASRPGPVLVHYDGSPTSVRALACALDVTGNRPAELVVLLSGEQPEETLRTQVEQRLQERGLTATVVFLWIESSAQLLDAVRRRRSRLLLIVGRDSVLLDQATLETLVSEVECPVGLVR